MEKYEIINEKTNKKKKNKQKLILFTNKSVKILYLAVVEDILAVGILAVGILEEDILVVDNLKGKMKFKRK
jgi:hypothetical protein